MLIKKVPTAPTKIQTVANVEAKEKEAARQKAEMLAKIPDSAYTEPTIAGVKSGALLCSDDDVFCKA